MKKRLLLLLMLMPLMVMGQGLTRDRVLRAMRQRPVAMGADNLFNPEYFHLVEGKRVGLVGNHSSLLGDGKKHLLDTLLSRGVAVCTLYSPEHGFRGTAEAGAKVDNSTDEKTGLPIVSLYGKNKKPLPEQLQGIDVMLFDLQDVGCRFYTYISTLHYVMEACAEHGIALVVLDRPNPHMNYVDGPVLEPQQQSFVGMHPVPIVYGMSIGEYARMILGEHWLWMTGNAKGKWFQLNDKEYSERIQGFQLTVVPFSPWSPASCYTFPVPPSPNLPNMQAIALYPSLCLFEGTTISVGRGTPYPFQVIGKQPCTLDLREAATAPEINLSYLIEMYNCTPSGKFFLKNGFFDRLAGTDRLRKQIEKGKDNAEIHASWDADLRAFRAIRAKYKLYNTDPQIQNTTK